MTDQSERSPQGSGAVQRGALFLAVSGFLLLGMRQNLIVPSTLGHSVAQTLILVAAGLWALTRLRGERSQIRSRPLMIALLLYTIGSLMSYASATGHGISQASQHNSDVFMVTNFVLVAMALTIMAMLTTTAGVVLVFKGLLLGGTVSAGFAIVQSFTGMDLAKEFRLPGLKASLPLLQEEATREGIVRAQGSAAHPLELAAVLTMLVPLGIGIIGCARARGEKAWPWAICTILVLCAALLTVSRTAVIGLLVGVVVMAWRWPIRRLAAILAGVMLVVLVGWLLHSRVAMAFAMSFANSSTDPSVKSRAIGVAYASAHYREYLWFGEGAGTYSSIRNHPILDDAYLGRLLDTGVFGLTTYVVLLCIAFTIALRASAAEATDIAALAGGLGGSIAALIFASAILDVTTFPQIWYLAWFVMALAAVVSYISRYGDVMPGEFRSTSRPVIHSVA